MSKCSNCNENDASLLLDGLCKMCDMFVSQQAPGGVTDSTFLCGVGAGRQFDKTPHFGDQYAATAMKKGQCTTGKVYLSGLAAYPGDPRAWVSSRAEIKKLCVERNMTCEGAVNYKPVYTSDPKPDVALAPDIIAREVDKIIEKNPEAAHDRPALAEKVFKKHKPHWAK